MGLVSQKLRDSAKGQPCMFRIPYCCTNDPATTVFCHAPGEAKGMANKNHDFLGAFGCYACHNYMDQRQGPESERNTFWLYAMQGTLTWWVCNGYLKIVGDDADVKPRQEKLSKIVPRPKEFRR
jgi:hypothetical protein